MKILVIEDNADHRAAAMSQLTGFDITMARDVWEARRCLESGEFDAVLTDMNMPNTHEKVCRPGFQRQDEQANAERMEIHPYGFVLALLAASKGVKYIGLLTDTNHHKIGLSNALDLIGPAYLDLKYDQARHEVKRFNINGATAVFVHAPMIEMQDEVVKDWKGILDLLMSEE